MDPQHWLSNAILLVLKSDLLLIFLSRPQILQRTEQREAALAESFFFSVFPRKVK
jgi:hypothetical protein